MDPVRQPLPYLYHISYENHDGEMFIPRVPVNRLERENDEVPRVCVSTDIIGAYIAIAPYPRMNDDYIFVHRVANQAELEISGDVWIPDNYDVPDADETGEIWLTGPVELECIRVIHIGKYKGEFVMDIIRENPPKDMEIRQIIDEYLLKDYDEE